MPLETLKKARRRTVGTKQTAKALDRKIASTVYVARDADDKVVRDILRRCREDTIEVEYIETMAALGKACGIDVGAAAAAVLKEEPDSGR